MSKHCYQNALWASHPGGKRQEMQEMLLACGIDSLTAFLRVQNILSPVSACGDNLGPLIQQTPVCGPSNQCLFRKAEVTTACSTSVWLAMAGDPPLNAEWDTFVMKAPHELRELRLFFIFPITEGC